MYNIKEISANIFDMSEDLVYDVIEKFNKNQNIDKSLTFVYIKAFYIHSAKLYLNVIKKSEIFEELYSEYKNDLINYYRANNFNITEDLINDITGAFDKSFEIIDSLKFEDIEDGYEFRHHVVVVFELFRQILENKSKSEIRKDLFENYITKFRNQAEEICEYISRVTK